MLAEAGDQLTTLELDAERRALVGIEVLRAARQWVAGGVDADAMVLGCRLDERALRRGLEQQYRALARLTHDRKNRRALVELANSVRPVTWV